MILFLTSSPCTQEPPEDADLVCTFNPANGFVDELRETVAPGSRAVYVAAYPDGFEGNDRAADIYAGCFAYAGLPLADMTVLDHRNPSEAADLISRADIVLLSGGHVPTEMAFFEEIDLRSLLADFDGVVLGTSAGSMNAADEVYAQPEEEGESVDPDYVRFFPGLGLTDLQILPHYQMVKDNLLDGRRLIEDITFEDSTDHCFWVLPDGSYIRQDDERQLLCGECWAIADGQMHKICENDQRIELKDD